MKKLIEVALPIEAVLIGRRRSRYAAAIPRWRHPEDLMTLQEFTLVQQQDGRHALHNLVGHCMRRFLAAASLVEIGAPVIKRIQDATYQGNVDLTPLYPAWKIICERYRKERFDPQATFFKEHSEDVLERWGQFLHWQLFPHLLRENEMSCVRPAYFPVKLWKRQVRQCITISRG